MTTTIDEVRDIAIEFVGKSDMKQCSAKFAEVRQYERFPNEWSVVFDLYSRDGTLIDSPFIVIVDKATMQPRFR
jgi:hypothetical protein